MSISSSWIHGNALTIESPIMYRPNGEELSRLILTSRGQGAWVSANRGGASSWMHLPIPTIYENTNEFVQSKLFSVSLLFQSWNSSIEFIHVYDGWEKIQEFNGRRHDGGLDLSGNHLLKDHSNTFILDKPHEVKRGIGLSFFFRTPTVSGQRELFVAGACADFRTRNILDRLRDVFKLSR